MDTVDGTEHYKLKVSTELPSLLVVIFDTNPAAWLQLNGALPFQKALADVLIFINAHLAFSHANRAAVIGSHVDKAVFLSPPDPRFRSKKGTAAAAAAVGGSGGSGEKEGGGGGGSEGEKKKKGKPKDEANVDPLRDANKYREFRIIEDEVTNSLRKLVDSTDVDGSISEAKSQSSSISGALSMALSYISKMCFRKADEQIMTAEEIALGKQEDSKLEMHARILIVSVSGDLALQYIPVMNSIFAAQKLKIPIDVAKLRGDTSFLQQASDATGGIYMSLEHPSGFLQYLMMAFLPDYTSRQALILPTQVDVDFRSACFCHKKVLDVGFVCSICLSIFCAPPAGAVCTTCGNKLDVTSLGHQGKPAVKKRLKKKKKLAAANGTGTGTNSAAESPAP